MNLFRNDKEEIITGTIVDHGMVVDSALFSGSGDVIIRGIVRADVDIDGDITVDSSGSVSGNVICTNCIIRGKVEGDISATNAITITEEGCVYGDILCSALQVSHGGNFRGCCNKPNLVEKKINVQDLLFDNETDDLQMANSR